MANDQNCSLLSKEMISSEQRLHDFAVEISALCRRFQVGLANASVFFMEAEDFDHDYIVDARSALRQNAVSAGSTLNLDLEASQGRYQLQYALERR